ncbi:hypothetical protein GCM10011403_20080 [Pseudohongiella nitratireducens]|uniref:HTH cro/C1-type domain-containing protein n=1 Tax=Pseudohongiella nitratireducens TaxID=1768907 RepID=A0A916QKQ0_9GAMM|nr:helix-turn-helix transcriptional regulator [Pseudohongiella nitratireducens]GFZ77029.1 hypothetical protein GCM10011403_20080 [Pseudohongiella nitratireducens]
MASKGFIDHITVASYDDYKALAANIKNARKLRGYSQREIASCCGMSFTTYQAIEKASLTVSFGAVLAALGFLELSAELQKVAAIENDRVGRQRMLIKLGLEDDYDFS